MLARVHRACSRPGPLAQVTRLGQGSTPPLQGTARPARSVRFIDPAPGRPDCSRTPLGFIGPAPGSARCDLRLPVPGRDIPVPRGHARCAGFYGPQLAGPARKLGSLARVHRAHPGSGPPAQVTRDGQGSTAPLQGTARPAHPVRFIDPAPGQPDGSRTPLGFIGPAPGSARCELRIPGHRAHQRARPAR